MTAPRRRPPPIPRLAALAALIGLACGCAGQPPGGHPPRNDSAAPAPSGGTVVVEKGDSLYRIARRHGISIRELIAINDVRPPRYVIHPGQRLRLPERQTHLVARGETLRAVSERYRIPVNRLARTNGIAAPYRLREGQRLALSDRPPVAAAARRPRGPPPPRSARSARPPPAALAKPPPRRASRFLWPVRGPVAVGFGPRGKGLYNDGVNILARRGTPVKAAENGVVAYAGNEIRGFGNLLLVKHAGGWMSAYAHNQTLLVRAGQTVRRGEPISRVGSSGSVQRPQLHFELRRRGRVVDPLRYLARPQRVSRSAPAVSPAARPDPG